jgi:hypothetical protein
MGLAGDEAFAIFLPCSISFLARSRVYAVGLFLSRQGRFMFLVL